MADDKFLSNVKEIADLDINRRRLKNIYRIVNILTIISAIITIIMSFTVDFTVVVIPFAIFLYLCFFALVFGLTSIASTDYVKKRKKDLEKVYPGCRVMWDCEVNNRKKEKKMKKGGKK